MPLEGWPAQAGDEREEKILDAVRAGNYELSWCPLELNDGTGTLRVLVSCDALKIDGVRVNVDATTQQQIADIIGAVLLTPKLADEIWKKTAPRNRLDPRPQPITSSTAGMIAHSGRVDAEILQNGSSGGPVADPGKDWVIVKSIFSQSARAARKAANYGWHVPDKPYQGLNPEGAVTPGLYVVQGVGTAHDSAHVDYSQVARFAHRAAKFGELPVDMIDVYTGDSPGNSLVSHEGPLPDWRQPGGPLNGQKLVPPRGQPPPAPPVGTATSSKKPGSTAPIVGVGAGAAIGALAGGPTGAAIGGAVGGILGLLIRRR